METQPLAEVKARLSEYVDRVAKQQDRVTITRNGRPVAVLVSVEDLDSLEETVSVMSDPEMMAGIVEGADEVARGEGVPLEQALSERLRRPAAG